MPHIKSLLASKIPLVAALSYSTIISILFFIPTSGLPDVNIAVSDKLVHGFIYFILMNLWMVYFYVLKGFQLNLKWVFILFLAVLLYGIIIELLQGYFTVSRSADIFDIAANLIGSIFGIFFFKYIKQYLNA